MPKTYHLITGANASLGLIAVRHLVRDPNVYILAPVRSFERVDQLRCNVPSDRLKLFKVDVSDLTSARACCEEVIILLRRGHYIVGWQALGLSLF